MNFDEFKNKFLEWTELEIEAKKEDGFPVCPYAKHARINNKIQFIDARQNTMDQLRTFDKENFEIGIAWIDDQDMQSIEMMTDYLHQLNDDLLYFTSTTDSGYFAKNFTDCVFIQLKADIMEKRDQLHKTNYYESWPYHYYHAITGN